MAEMMKGMEKKCLDCGGPASGDRLHCEACEKKSRKMMKEPTKKM